MSHQFRKAVEKMRHYYIQKLLQAGAFQDSKESPHSLTLSELENLYKKYKSQC